MRTRLALMWDWLNSTYWFVPGSMGLFTIILAMLSVRVDEAFDVSQFSYASWLYTGTPEGSREVLSAIATSMVTVAGVVFSITIVALSLASSQFGPRLLRNFMSDTGNQIVLGVFVSTFLFSLLVLRTIRGGNGQEFVPQVSVTLAVVLVLCSIGLLIYFIHHVSVSIQVDTIVARIGDQLLHTLEKLFPSESSVQAFDEANTGATVESGEEKDLFSLTLGTTGYVQAVDYHRLSQVLERYDLHCRIARRAGHYIYDSLTACVLWPRERVGREAARAVERCFVVGSCRTPAQDIEFSFHQLVEVAARALSPGINDPFTAISVIDQLERGFSRLVELQNKGHSGVAPPSGQRFSVEGIEFADLVASAFNLLRQNALHSVAVTIRLLDALLVLAGQGQTERVRAPLLRQAKLLCIAAIEQGWVDGDVADVLARFDRKRARGTNAELFEPLEQELDESNATSRRQPL